MAKKVIVIGAGIGGISTALRLAKRGYDVEILEKNSTPGGRMNQIKKVGFTFDTGPSFFSMSYEFKELADDCGINLPFEYYSLDPLYSVNFLKSGKTFHLYRNLIQLADQFKEIEPDFHTKLKAYLRHGEDLYNDTVHLVIHRNFDSLIGYLLSLMQVPVRHFPTLVRTFWQEVARRFSSHEVRQIISLVAFFLGRTPFDTPAVYTLLSYTEFIHDGYHNVKGGMYRIVEGLVDELNKAGVKIHFNTEITGYQSINGAISSFTDSNGRSWPADLFVVNADAAVFRGTIMKRKKFSAERLDKLTWTMGPLTIYLGINGKLPQINHHNYYLGENFETYAKKVFVNPSTMEKPYYYVNVLSKSNPECAPEGCESLFFVVPVPDLRYKSDWTDRDQIVEGIIADFSERVGTDIESRIVTKTILTPEDWGKMFNLHRGSGLGLSHDMNQVGWFRPKNKDEKFGNLFYTGASTVPGTGIPMAVISSKLVVQRIDKIYGSLS